MLQDGGCIDFTDMACPSSLADFKNCSALMQVVSQHLKPGSEQEASMLFRHLCPYANAHSGGDAKGLQVLGKLAGKFGRLSASTRFEAIVLFLSSHATGSCCANPHTCSISFWYFSSRPRNFME